MPGLCGPSVLAAPRQQDHIRAQWELCRPDGGKCGALKRAFWDLLFLGPDTLIQWSHLIIISHLTRAIHPSIPPIHCNIPVFPPVSRRLGSLIANRLGANRFESQSGKDVTHAGGDCHQPEDICSVSQVRGAHAML